MPVRKLTMAPRNDPLGFAERGWSNLTIIEDTFKTQGKGHVVTQLVQTLLSVLVFPKERWFYEYLSKVEISKLEKRDWPLPKQVIGTTSDMNQLLRHMRNAVCHGGVTFYSDAPSGSDSRFVEEITIEFVDRPKRNSDICWKVIMEGKDLRRFLYKIFERLRD